MDRLAQLDRRTRYGVGGAVAFVGVLLLVLGWYLISGQAVAAKQIPYLASASLPGAVLVVCGALLALTGDSGQVDSRQGDSGLGDETARKIGELHALLTEAAAEPTAELNTFPGPSLAESDG